MRHPLLRLCLAAVLAALLAVTLGGCTKKRRATSPTPTPDAPGGAIGKPARTERPARTTGTGPAWEQNVRIRSALDQGDARQAERLARAVIDKQPANAEAHFLLGKSLMAQNQREAARPFFEKAMALAPDNSLFRRALAENLDLSAQEAIARDDPRRAIELWKRCLAMKYKPSQIGQNLADAFRRQGERLRQKGQTAEAEKAYREAMALLPENPAPQLDLATLLLEADRLLEAERILKGLVESHPSFEPGQLAYARLLHRMGDIQGARTHLDRLLAARPDSEEAKALKAELDREVPLTPTPSGPEAQSQPDPDLVQKLTVLESAGNFQGQAALLREFLAANPNADWAYLRLAMALERAGDIPGALQAVETYLKGHADDPRAQFCKARCLQLSGDLDGALRILTILDQEKKANLQVYDEIGQVYAKKGQFEEAKKYWKKALAIDPEYAGVAFNFGQLAMEQGDFATARAWFDKAIQKEPYNTKYRYFAGLNLKQAGLGAEAQATWQSARAWLNTGDPYGARILRALGEDVPTGTPPATTTATTVMTPAKPPASAPPPPAPPLTAPSGPVPATTPTSESPLDQRYLAALEAARAGDFPTAIAGFQEVLRQQPDNVNALINLGKIYTAQEQHAKASLQYLLAVRAAPDNPHAAKALIKSYTELGLHRQAAELTGRLLQAHPNLAAEFPDYRPDAPLPRSNPRAYEPFVRLLLQHRQPEEALPIIQAAVEENPEMARFVVLEGEVRYCLNQLEAAEATLQRAIGMDNADPEPYIKLGDLYAARQRLDQAFAQYQLAQKARFLDPDTAFEIVDRLVAIGKKPEANLLLSRLKGMNLSESQLEKLKSRTETP